MAEPFLAQIKIFGFNFAPRNWAKCDGQILPINQHQSLYSLLGTNYGGDGRTTFALPDLRGRTPVHPSNSSSPGQKSGEETHVLSSDEIPQHKHMLVGDTGPATTNNPIGAAGNLLATASSAIYGNPDSLVPMNTGALANAGGSQGHENMQPFLTLNFCIALQGLFPSRN